MSTALGRTSGENSDVVESYDADDNKAGSLSKKIKTRNETYKRIVASITSDFFQNSSLTSLTSEEKSLLFQKCDRFDDLKNIGRQLAKFVDERITILKYNGAVQNLFRQKDFVSWKPEWVAWMKIWLSQITITVAASEEFISKEIAWQIRLTLSPNILLVISPSSFTRKSCQIYHSSLGGEKHSATPSILILPGKC